jgi:hypothetical protein
MVRMEVKDVAVIEIMATTFGVPVKRLILVKGSDHQDEMEEISHRIRDLGPRCHVRLAVARGTGPAARRA